MIDIVVHTNSIEVENPQADPYMYIATLYFDRDIFISSIPQSLFDENKNFLPTKSQINIDKQTPKEELEYISNRYVYIILHGITPPKKGKKPADNVSYPELTLVPNLFYQKLDIQKHIVNAKPDHSTINVEVENEILEMVNATTGQNTVIKLNYSYTITLPNPHYYKLQPFGLAIDNIQINGLFQSFKPSYTSIPTCGWNCKLNIPSVMETLELASNGFLCSKPIKATTQESNEGEEQKQTPLSQLLNNYNDLLLIGQQKKLQLTFSPATTLINQQAIDTSFDSLYNLIMDPKNVDKQKQADVKAFTDKLVQFYSTKLNIGQPVGGKDKKPVATPDPAVHDAGQVTFTALFNALKDAISDGFNKALKEYNEEQLANADPKKKPQTVAQTVFAIEGDLAKFLLFQEERAANSRVFYLTKTQVDSLRQSILSTEVKCKLTVELDSYWTDAFQVEGQNFTSICTFDLQCLKQRNQCSIANLVLEMTEDQKQLETQQNKPPSASQGAKKDPKKDKGGVDPINVLVKNRSTATIFVNFGKTEVSPEPASIIKRIKKSIPGFVMHVYKLRDLVECRQMKASFLQSLIFEIGAHLPPCKIVRTKDEELKYELIQEMKQVRKITDKTEQQQKMRVLIQNYKKKLRETGMNVSTVFALLQQVAKDSFAVSLQDDDSNVAKMLTLARNTIQTTPLKKSFDSCIKLFSGALVRERANNLRHVVTLQMEMAVFGSLICAVSLDDQNMVQRTLLRATDLALIHPIRFIPLACLTSGLLVQHGEAPLALSLLISTVGALELNEEQFNIEQLHLNTLLFYLLHENGKIEAANELLNILVAFIRKNNEKLKLMSGLSLDYSDRYVQANLLLSLGEYLTFNRVGLLAKAVIDFMKKNYLETSYEQLQSRGQVDGGEVVPECVIEVYKDTVIPVIQIQAQNEQKSTFKGINLRETILQLKTKYMLILSRLLLGAGRIGDIRNMLHKPNFLTTRKPGEEFETFKLLRYLKSGEKLPSSYLQIFDPRTIDTTIPGVLSAYAMSSVNSYKIPGLMECVTHPIPQLLVCGVLNGLVTQRAAETSKPLRLPKEEIIKRAKAYIPEGIELSENTIIQMYALNAQAVICNTRVAYEMMLIARCWSYHLKPKPGYGYQLDCPILTGYNYERDKTFISGISRCALRCFHVFEVIEVPVPYRSAGPDEIEIAKRIYKQSRFYKEEDDEELQSESQSQKIKNNKKSGATVGAPRKNSSSASLSRDREAEHQMRSMKRQESKLRNQAPVNEEKKIGKIETLTNDYLAALIPTEAIQHINIVVPLIMHILSDPLNRRMGAEDYPDPDMYVLYGAFNLFASDNCLALNSIQRALQLDNTSQIGWLGIALTLSNQLYYQTDEVMKDKIRNKIIEALRRTDASQWLGGLDQFMIAICTALINPRAEKSTLYATMGTVIIHYIKMLPDLVPLIIDTNQTYKFENTGTAGFITQWHINRLKAICFQSCETQDRVAKSLTDALGCLGGTKPGASVAEIAERILLLTEAADAWTQAGNPEKAHQIMRAGLIQ